MADMKTEPATDSYKSSKRSSMDDGTSTSAKRVKVENGDDKVKAEGKYNPYLAHMKHDGEDGWDSRGLVRPSTSSRDTRLRPFKPHPRRTAT